MSTIHVDIDWIGIALLQYEGVRFCVAVLIFEICIMHFSVNHNHDPIQSNEIIQFHEECKADANKGILWLRSSSRWKKIDSDENVIRNIL